MNLITLKQIIVITFIITLLVICIEYVEDLINYDANLLTIVKLLSIITIIGLLVTYVVVLERKKSPADDLLDHFHGPWGGDLKKVYEEFSY